MKIIADDKIPFLKGVFEDICEIEYWPGAEIDKSKLQNADALITRTRTKCNVDSLEGTQVKMIASATIGFDHIDTSYCEANGIKWTNSPGCNAESVKQYIASVFGMLVIERGWILQGKKIAVVGVGNVGQRVAVLAEAIGMEVYRVDPPRSRKEQTEKFYALDEIISEMDIVTFHTPLNRDGDDKTFHLCDERLLSKMKESTVVVNSSRGEVINGDDLKVALMEGVIDGAVLDVWENEPELDKQLLNKVWLSTPHIAGYSQDGKANGTMMSVQAISKQFSLGLDNWTPSDLPEPKNSFISIDCQYLSDEQVLANAFISTYKIKEDDIRLRMNIKEFEKQRGNYPIRREFRAFEIELIRGTDSQVHLLEKFGFKNVSKSY